MRSITDMVTEYVEEQVEEKLTEDLIEEIVFETAEISDWELEETVREAITENIWKLKVELLREKVRNIIEYYE